MKRALFVLVSAALLFTTAQARQTSKDDAERLLRAAQNTEVVDGNPRAAIKQYQAIVDRFSKTERASVATALLRMADCYRKLGDDEAKRILQLLVRDYTDQPAVVSTARARLSLLPGAVSPTGTVQRQVWVGQSRQHQYGGISRDGRWLLYTYNSGPDSEADKWGLHIRDLSSGTNRKLVASTFLKNREQVDYRSALSRDNQQAAYSWQISGRMELRIISINGPAAPPRVLISNDDIRWIAPHDWTPDGKFIAVDLRRPDNTTQIGLVNTSDGSVRVLKSVNWNDSGVVAFSPNGKYLAFSQLDPDDSTGDIFVLATDGSREFPMVFKGSDSVIGWSANGTELLFLSDRTGSFGVWSQPFTDRPSGSPKLIKPDVGALNVIGLTTAGALYYTTTPPAFQSDITFASLDLAEGRVLSMPVVAVQENVGTNNSPRWSHDGKQWAYLSSRHGSDVLVIRSADDNRIVREWRLKENPRLASLRWAPDDRSLTIDGATDGRQGVFRIDAQTGQVTPIVMQPPDGGAPGHQWSADGKTLYVQRTSGRAAEPGDVALIAFDVVSKTETDVMRAPRERMARYGTNYAVSPDGKTVYFTRLVTPRDLQQPGNGSVAIVARDTATGAERTLGDGAWRDGALLVSPDGRHIVRNRSATTNQWMLVPTNGNEPRALTTLAGGVFFWSADSRGVFFRESAPSTALWFVPVDGRDPKRLNLELSGSILQFSLHPDGQRVVFVHSVPTGAGSRPPSEVWVIDNLLPKSAPAKK